MLHLIGFYDYTVILTYASLVSAVIGMMQASKGDFTKAVCCLVVSGVCDAFDGMVARTKKSRTEDEKAFGIQLDSLCDVVSFGVFPALLCYFAGVNDCVGCGILVLYCLCAVIRLAFFNVIEGKRQQTEGGANKSYRGLPVTTISILLPLLFIFRSLIPGAAFVVMLHVLMVLTAFLFVLDFSVKKPDWKRILTGGR